MSSKQTRQTKDILDIDASQDGGPMDFDRREALEKLVKYTPPAMITLLAKDSAWAQISGGPPPPPSDQRLKTDIHYLCQSEQGYPLYRFRYISDVTKTEYVGVMAQDVMENRPDAVTLMEGGYYAVYYDRIGLRMSTYQNWQEQGLSSVQL